MRFFFLLLCCAILNDATAQNDPAIISWDFSPQATNASNTKIKEVLFSSDWVTIKIYAKPLEYIRIPLHPETTAEKDSVDDSFKGLYLNGDIISNDNLPCTKFVSQFHSPIIGFALDGNPVYGPYGFSDSGAVIRMCSGYRLRQFKKRQIAVNGKMISYGPKLSKKHPAGSYPLDYEYAYSKGYHPEILDPHNGKFCITPEYPEGHYCYFLTIGTDLQPAYPYTIGPTFFSKKSGGIIDKITDNAIPYSGIPAEESIDVLKADDFTIVYTDKGESIVMQSKKMLRYDITLQLFDKDGIFLKETTLPQGSTMAFFDTKGLFNGQYKVQIITPDYTVDRIVSISR